jgi:hypothetical protein
MSEVHGDQSIVIGVQMNYTLSLQVYRREMYYVAVPEVYTVH